MNIKTWVAAIATVVGFSVFATDIEVADGGTTSIDLQGSDNAAGNRVVFAGSGTLTLTNPGGGEAVFLPQIVAAEEGAEVVVDAVACEGHGLRLKNHVSVKGTLGVVGPSVVKFGDTAVTAAVLDAAKAVVAAFPMLDIGGLAGGTAVTIDGAAQIMRKVAGMDIASTALVALSGANALGEADEYALGDYDAMIVNTNAFKAGATVKVAAGRVLGYFPADVGADFGWTEKAGVLALNVALGESAERPAKFMLWATAKNMLHRIYGSVSGYGDVEARPMRSDSPTTTYTFVGRQTFKGKLVSWKVTNISFSMGVPEDGVVGFTAELTNINTLSFYTAAEYGSTDVKFPGLKAGFYNTTLSVQNGQTVTLGELQAGSGGLNVTGAGVGKSRFVLEKNSVLNQIIRLQDVAYTLDQATLDANPYYVTDDNNGARDHYRGYATWAKPMKATRDSLLYNTASGSKFSVVVREGCEGSFTDVADGFTFTVRPGAKLTLANAKQVNQVTAERDATVVLDGTAADVAVVSHGATVEYAGDLTGWEDMVGLWLDASKAETIHALTNASGTAVRHDRCGNVGEATHDACAWWYDWRESQKTYYLYNNRCYLNGSYIGGLAYVNPWRQETGGPNNGPFMHFGQVSGHYAYTKEDGTAVPLWSGTPARLEVHVFGEPLATTREIATKYVAMVYGASKHANMRGGASLYQGGTVSYSVLRNIDDATRGKFEDPILNMNDAQTRPLRLNGAAEKPANECYFQEGWQVIGLDVSNGGGNFAGLGRGNSTVGGGQMYAEVLVFTNAPSLLQKIAVERYLAQKWGLSITPASTKITANVSGTGTVKVGGGIDLEVGNAFHGSVVMQGGELTLPTGGKLVPDDRGIPTEGQLAWFDPSVSETLKMSKITDEEIARHPGSEQTNEVAWVYDRVADRRGGENVSLASSSGCTYLTPANRRMHLLQTAFGNGEVMNWLDGNNYYKEIDNDLVSPKQWGNAMRFWRNKLVEMAQNDSDQAMAFKTAFIVQESSRGGGTPVANAYSMSGPYKRETTDPKAALWKTGVDESLTGGSVWVNSRQVANPLKSAEFTGGPEVLTIQTKEDTSFPAKAIGNFGDSEQRNPERAACYGEILFYDKALEEADRKDVEAYLAWKWFGGVLDGYAAPKGYTISGVTALSVETAEWLPNLADDFSGTVNISSPALSFEIDSSVSTDRASSGFFDVKGGALTVGEGSCEVTVTAPAKAAKGAYKLIGWGKSPATAFTLSAASAKVGGRTAQLRVEADGLYVELLPNGLMMIVR